MSNIRFVYNTIIIAQSVFLGFDRFLYLSSMKVTHHNYEVVDLMLRGFRETLNPINFHIRHH